MSFCLLLISLALAAVDVNTAEAAALEGLPGIGPSKAQAIIAWRTANGPFKSLDDLDQVDGIGPSTLANLRDQVSFGAAPGAKAPATRTVTPTAAATTAPAPTAAGCPVNINTADVSGLTQLPGIGEGKASTILQYRVDNGNFGSCAALDNVSGIGPATLAGLMDCCVVK